MRKNNSDINKLLQEGEKIIEASGAAIKWESEEMEKIRKKKEEIETKLSFLL